MSIWNYSAAFDGVGFYINDALDFAILSTIVNDDLCDSLFVEFIIKLPCTYQTYKIILGNIYRPPRQSVENYSDFITSLEQTLESFQNVDNVILVGDFNIDLLKIHQNEHANSFFETLLSNGYIPTITQPTRITDYSKTLIDNCFIKCFDNSPVTNSAILLQNISDHQPYLTCFDYSIQTKPAPKFIKTQTKSPKAIEYLKNELKITCTIEKFLQYSTGDCDSSFEFLDKSLKTAISNHMPIRIKKYHKHKHKNSKWVTSGIIRSIRFRDKLYKRLKDTPVTDQIHSTLKINLHTYNKILKKCIRDAKKQYYHSCFKKCSNDIKKTWKAIKEIMGNPNNNSTVPEYFMINNVKYTEPSIIANKFNNFFVNIGPSLANKIPHYQNLSFKNFLTNNIETMFQFEKVTETYIEKIIDQMKPKTSQGIDNISNQLLKAIKSEITPVLTVIINQCLETGKFPTKLKLAKVLPIYKKNEEFLLDNYRPISILPSLSKVFERVMHNQIYS